MNSDKKRNKPVSWKLKIGSFFKYLKFNSIFYEKCSI